MRFCLHPGCSERVKSGRCEDHARPREQQQRGNSNERGYDWRWRKAAKRFLSEYPLCGRRPGGVAPVMSQCHDEGRISAAVQVDHVEPHRGDPVKFWDERNWQPLCRECGARKSQAGL